MGDRAYVWDHAGQKTVFVGNLPWSTTDEDLQQIFAPYEPYDCHVKTNMAGRSRGFGILRCGFRLRAWFKCLKRGTERAHLRRSCVSARIAMSV